MIYKVDQDAILPKILHVMGINRLPIPGLTLFKLFDVYIPVIIAYHNLRSSAADLSV